MLVTSRKKVPMTKPRLIGVPATRNWNWGYVAHWNRDTGTLEFDPPMVDTLPAFQAQQVRKLLWQAQNVPEAKNLLPEFRVVAIVDEELAAQVNDPSLAVTEAALANLGGEVLEKYPGLTQRRRMAWAAVAGVALGGAGLWYTLFRRKR